MPIIKHRRAFPCLLPLVLVAAMADAHADSLSLRARMVPQEQIRLDFEDGSGHFVLMVRREGQAAAPGLFDGAHVTEFGRHDIVPSVGGDPSGYLVIRQGSDDVAYLKWTVRSITLPGHDGRPELIDNGFWEVVSGTGRFKDLKGTGTLRIESAGPVDRLFILDGTLVPAKR